MRLLIIAIGLLTGFALTWWIADMVTKPQTAVHMPESNSAARELPRLLRPGLGFAFLAPRHG